MNRDDLRPNEQILASDSCNVHRGLLSFSGKLFLTNIRLVFEPVSQIDKWAGADGFEIDLTQILMLDLRGLRKKVYIVTEEQEFRFSGPGSLRIYEKLHSIHHAFSIGNSVHSLEELQEIIYHQGSINVVYSNKATKNKPQHTKTAAQLKFNSSGFFISQKELRLCPSKEEVSEELFEEIILVTADIKILYFEQGELHIEDNTQSVQLSGSQAPYIFVVLLAHQEDNFIYAEDLTEIYAGQGLRQNKLLWYCTNTFVHFVSLNNKNEHTLKLSRESIFSFHQNDQQLLIKIDKKRYLLNIQKSPTFMKRFESFFLTQHPTTDTPSILDTPLNFWAIECANPLSSEQELQESIPTKISLNHSRLAFVQRGEKSHFGILELNVEFHEHGCFSILKFSRRVYFLCNERYISLLKHFLFLIDPPNLQHCFYGERLPLSSLFFHPLHNPFYSDKKSFSEPLDSIKAHPVSYIGWEIKTKHSFKSHHCVQAEVNTPNGIVLLRSRIKRQKLSNMDKSIWFIPYPILLFRMNRRTHFRTTLNIQTVPISLLEEPNSGLTAVNICNKGLCLKIESKNMPLLNLKLEAQINFECFEQTWSGVIKWTKSRTKNQESSLFCGIAVEFSEKSTKLLWIKHVHSLNVKR